GGSSILGMQMILRARQLGLRLDVQQLFRTPTILGLTQANPADPSGCLLPIRRQGTGPPLFLVHPATALALAFEGLADSLQGIPVYGINNPRLGQRDRAFATVEEMAQSYLRAVRAVQTEGPYRLGGWSFGGLVALDMARQLRGHGREVEVVILI